MRTPCHGCSTHVWSLTQVVTRACRGVSQAQAKLDATRTRETAHSARARTLAHIEVLKGNATAAKVAADASASLEGERGLKLARVQLLQQLQVRRLPLSAPRRSRRAVVA